MIPRLGLLGGMFDPVHKGHVAAARYARDLLQLDCVKMLPCNQPNHRAAGNASAQQRLAMLELALSDEDLIEADALELNRGGVSYSIDTLMHFSRESVASQVVFILGIDAMNTITKWHRWQEMFEYCHFLVLGRENRELNLDTREAITLNSREVMTANELFDRASGSVYIASEFSFEASSSYVRELLSRKVSLENLLPEKVDSYIKSNNLYCAWPGAGKTDEGK